jgi:hypothetical protein
MSAHVRRWRIYRSQADQTVEAHRWHEVLATDRVGSDLLHACDGERRGPLAKELAGHPVSDPAG